MNQKEVTKWEYIAPACKIIRTELESFVCTSVMPDSPNSQEEDWEADTEVDGGEHEFE